MSPKLGPFTEGVAQGAANNLNGDRFHEPEADLRGASFASVRGGSIVDDQITQLARRLFLTPAAGAIRQVIFCGVDGESGSSSVCAQTGQVLGELTSLPICLIDANPRVRRLSNIVGTFGERQQGCVQLRHNLWQAEIVLPSGRGRDVLPVNQVANQLQQLGKEFNYILIDTPGVNVNSDATLLGQMAGVAVLVVEAGITRRPAALRAKSTLEGAGIRLVGTVLHNRSYPIPEPLYRRL